MVTSTVHRLWAPPGKHFAPGGTADCEFNTTLTFAECNTSDWGTTARQ